MRILRGSETQSAYAIKFNISLPALQNYESGKRIPPSAVLSKIAALKGVSIEWILTGEDNPLIQQLAAVSAHRLDNPLIQQIAEAAEVYRLDTIEKKVVKLMEEMSEEEKKAVLKHVEAQKHLIEALKKAEEKKAEKIKADTKRTREKAPRPIPIEFSAMERHALHLYELAEKRGLAGKMDELIARLLSEFGEPKTQEEKEAQEGKDAQDKKEAHKQSG